VESQKTAKVKPILIYEDDWKLLAACKLRRNDANFAKTIRHIFEEPVIADLLHGEEKKND
jgi:hypothetical protein